MFITCTKVDVSGDPFQIKGFVKKEKNVKVGKNVVNLLVNAAGEEKNPIAIWTSQTFGCYRGIAMDSLPVK